MKVYIEYVLFNNLALDLLLLYWSALTCARKIKFIRFACAALLGAGYALVSPFMDFTGAFFLHILVALLMTYLAVSWVSLKKWLSFSAVFVAYSAALGGMVTGLFNLTKSTFFAQLDFKNGLLAGVMALAALIGTVVIKQAVYRVKHAKRKAAYECDVCINIKGKQLQAKGFYDSGNRLYLSSGTPVILLDQTLADEAFFETLDAKTYSVHIKTVAAETEATAYALDKVEIVKEGERKIYENIAACVSKKRLANCQILLHCDM